MKIITSYTKKWLIYILSFFLLFTALLLLFENRHERNFRIEALNTKLDDYVGLTYRYLSGFPRGNGIEQLDSLNKLISDEAIRITIIMPDGVVTYDSQVDSVETMENHLFRPEVQEAIEKGYGTNVRVSGTTSIKYYYFARNYPEYFVRVSVVYDIGARKFLQPDRLFLILLLVLFLAASLAVVLLTDKFGKSLNMLREFTLRALANQPIDKRLVFPDNELGALGKEIIDIYQRLNRTKEELISEKAKLIRHLNLLEEGIAIFTKDKDAITSNNHFIQFINHISDTRIFTADEFFKMQEFSSIFGFIDKYLMDNTLNLDDIQPTHEITLNKGGKYYLVKCIVFQDRSFEVSVNDITKPTKRKILKQQITENLAHELKTPVSSIKGFLETILDGETDKARTTDYLKRAYSQSCRLADLIHDISLLTKIEEAGSLYHIEKVNVDDLIRDIAGEIQPQLHSNYIKLELDLPENLIIEGNSGLVYSIFRNLFDNAITYGGRGLTIRIDNYRNDEEFLYFSFSDTGVGVPEDDLPRLFERFYRVEKGRDRKKGGTGLGLAIVKNAIQFHRGNISVKNRSEGGLEFLFTLAKEFKGHQE